MYSKYELLKCKVQMEYKYREINVLCIYLQI